MYTVIIAEQGHFEKFSEYQLFLRPFMKTSQIAFCRWVPEEKTLNESLPDLAETVGQREQWKAVILCNEDGLTKQNPFDLVSCEEPVRNENGEETLEDFYARRIAAKKNAYDAASEEPFVQLVTRLCEDPVVRKAEDKDTRAAEKTADDETEEEISDTEKREEMDYQEYRQCILYKQKLRDEIRGEESISFSLPSEIYCVAMRHCEDAEYALNNAWSSQDESRYSRFYDRNMYYDKMRYLVFDMSDEQKATYRSDYIRYMISVMLLAGNDIPDDCLRPNRVYTLQCELDENNLTRLMNRYNGKLEVTKENLESQEAEIRTREPERISDEEVEKIFCADVSISVDFQSAGNQDDLYCRERFGLSGDCPVDNEEMVWAGSYSKNKKAVKDLTKQSSRAVREATDKFHKMNTVSDIQSYALNEYQVEDVKEYVDREEKEMIDTNPSNVFDNRKFFDRMDEKQQDVLDVMKTRMRRNGTILVGVLCLSMIVVGAAPMFFMNRLEDFFNLPIPATVVLLILALLVVAVAALICLLVLRGQLKEQVSAYNATMSSIAGNIERSTGTYGVYLSHACNVMRGNSVLRRYDAHDGDDSLEMIILQKHIESLETQQAELADIFGRYLNRTASRTAGEEEMPYDYDFSRPADYEFPLPAEPDLETKIEFLEPGNYVDIPYGIVKSMRLRREELYD